ncbi:MAG: hypothetical protein C4538_03910 [Nitrospiraceae bacterium]|nr:MAG: hypothetical protein C4538_03910 [Nitrospiraceae bacterium]
MNYLSMLRNIIVLFFVVPVLFACTEDRKAKVAGSSKDKDAIASHMASLNMQHITEPTAAPDFELATVTGKKVRLSEYRGKAVLLSFWATW